MSDRSNIIDFRTGKAIFSDGVRAELESNVGPLLKDGATPENVVNTVEQVLCTALVSGAVSLATKLASSLADKITRK